MLPFIWLHFVCTHLGQLVHCIELLPIPLPHEPHGHLAAFCNSFWRSPLIITLVFIFTLIPLFSTLKLSVDGDADAAVEARIRIGWNKFRQLVPLLTDRDISLIRRGRLYSSCVQSSMLHGSETWLVRKENEVALQWAEMGMVRWMCNVKVKDRVPSKELRERLGIDWLIRV